MFASEYEPIIVFGWHGKDWGWLPVAKSCSKEEGKEVIDRLFRRDKWDGDSLCIWSMGFPLPGMNRVPPDMRDCGYREEDFSE